mgnify:FL=1
MRSSALEKLKDDLRTIALDVIAQSGIKCGEIFVLGCSSSEIIGETIGKHSSQEVGDAVVSTLHTLLSERGIFLAVQGCEHINRALAIERGVAETKGFPVVSVVPILHAGGACSVAAFKRFKDPVEIEHIVATAGLDIGDTSIGMHIRHVQIPIRPVIKTLGSAHVTALGSRPKLIGGERAAYR